MQASKPRECSPHPWLLGYPARLPCARSHQCDAGSSWVHGTSLDFFILKVGLKTPSWGCDGLRLVFLFSLPRDELEPPS